MGAGNCTPTALNYFSALVFTFSETIAAFSDLALLPDHQGNFINLGYLGLIIGDTDFIAGKVETAVLI